MLARRLPLPFRHRLQYRERRDVVEITGCGGDGPVPQLLADDADVEPFLTQFRCHRVPQTVGVHATCDASQSSQRSHQAAHVSCRQSPAALIADEWLISES